MSLREISEFLFVSDPPEPADLIFVFGGKRTERADKAARLFGEGYAPRVWIAGGDKRSSGVPEALELRERMVSQGVPADAINVETNSTTTLEQVLYSYPQLEMTFGWDRLRKVILVSAPMHMRRAKRTFARYCPKDTRIICCPDDRADVRADNWWTTAEGRALVLHELEKVRDGALKGAC